MLAVQIIKVAGKKKAAGIPRPARWSRSNSGLRLALRNGSHADGEDAEGAVDVAEEMDRLDAHIDEVQRVLDQDGPIGRRLDFLMQEMNRESNTLGSKSAHLDTTNSSVYLKVLIEQMREQIQNIE